MVDRTNSFNKHVIVGFNEAVYNNILAEDDILGNEIALSNSKDCGFVFKKGYKTYFVKTKYIFEEIEQENGEKKLKIKLPLKVKEEKKIIDRSNVYYYIKDPIKIVLSGKDTMTFKELIDKFCPFTHNKQSHFTLYKIMCIAAYISQLHWRVATDVAFGKTCLFDALRELTNKVARVNKATKAKLEYVTNFPLINANEVANLKEKDIEPFADYAIALADGSMKYTKTTRKYKNTKEIISIKNTSLCFTYNSAKYMWGRGAKSFDELFKDNMLDKFLPLHFKGVLTLNQFKNDNEMDIQAEVKRHRKYLLDFVRQLNFFKENPIKRKHDYPQYDFKEVRWEDTFHKLCVYLGAYATDQKEYEVMCAELYKCHLEYLNSQFKQEFGGQNWNQ